MEVELSENIFKKYKVFFMVLFSLLFISIVAFLFLTFGKTIIFNDDISDNVILVNSDFEVPLISACYGNRFKCKKASVSVVSGVDTTHVGDYDVVYRAVYNGKMSEYVKKFSVVDREAPVIDSPDSVSICPNATDVDIMYSAVDNYDGDITGNVVKEIGDDSLLLSVFDSSSNFFVKNVMVVREDTEKPVISLKGNSNMYIRINSSFSDPMYSASDNCDGDITSRVSVSGSVDTSRAGTYKLTYSVSDSASNSTSVTRNVYVYSGNGDGSRVIYLTFDDGPSAYTGELLNILARYNVKATFFVTNSRSNYAYYIREAYNQGHSIALHTSSHNYSTVYSSEEAYFDDLNRISDTVYNQTGIRSKLIRFPGGSSNTVSRKYSSGIMTRLAASVTEKGYKYFDWNVSSGDADGGSHDPSYYANNIIRQLGNNSYYIVLQHDININSIRSVSTVIEYGLAHGYTFLPLTESSPTVHHKINN